MDRRSSCYLNSAYNRNVDDFDDYIDNESQLSFNSSQGHSYESENETFVDAYLDDPDTCFSEDDQLAAFDQHQIGNRSYSLQQLQRYHSDAYSAANVSAVDAKSYQQTDRLTSTPKKQCLTPSGRKNPHRREAIVRRRSLSSLSHHRSDDVAPPFLDATYQRAAIRRSKSSLSLRPRVHQRRQLQFQQHQQYAAAIRRSTAMGAAAVAAATAAARANRYASPSPNLHNLSEPALRLPSPCVSAAVSPFRIRQRTTPTDLFAVRNPFLRRPYDLNSSCSSSKPLVPRNTAVISPIYNTKMAAATASVAAAALHSPSHFDIVDNSRTTLSISAGDRSMSSTKTSSWLHQIRKPRLPLCTLRTSAITMLVSGTLTCLLCIHIISQRGKSYELTFSIISGFLILCLGFPCLRFQEWQWLPNRNYVSGYIILSLFSVLQSIGLWILDKYPNLQPELVDLTKGALCGISSLSLSLAVLGVCASCCCKYPPPDNRVNHGVQGFTV